MSKNSKIKNMSFVEMVHFEAIFDILTQSNDFVERKIRRWAVKELNISYFQTFEMPWPEILQHYYEVHLMESSKNKLIQTAKDDYLETIQSEEELDNERFLRQAEEEEAERLRQLEEVKKEKQSLNKDNDVPEIKEMNLSFDLKE